MKRILFLTIILTISNFASAQHAKFSKQRDFDEYAVSSLATDENGMVWVGTKKGLVSISKENEITDYIKQATPKINKKIYQIHFDDKGVLYMPATRGTLINFDGKDKKEISVSTKLKKGNPTSIATRGGKVYLANSKGYMVEVSGSKIKKYKSPTKTKVNELVIDSNGEIWVFSSNYIYHKKINAKGKQKTKNKGKVKKKRKKREKKRRSKKETTKSKNKKLKVPKGWTLSDFRMKTIKVVKKGDIYWAIGRIKGKYSLVKSVNLNNWEEIEIPCLEKEANTAIHDLSVTENSVWLATEDGVVLYDLTKQKFTKFNKNGRFVGVNKIAAQTDKIAYANSRDEGFQKIKIVDFIKKPLYLMLDTNLVLPNISFHKLQANYLDGKTVKWDIDKVVEFVDGNDNYMLSLFGYTDKMFSEEAAVELSEKRVKKVKNSIVEAGLPEERIKEIKWFGDKKLIYQHPKNEKEKQANRRIEIRVTSVESPEEHKIAEKPKDLGTLMAIHKVRLREQASTESPMIRWIKKNEVVKVLEKIETPEDFVLWGRKVSEDHWYKVEYLSGSEKEIGWVFGYYTNRKLDQNNEANSNYENISFENSLFTTQRGVKLREEATTDKNNIIFKLPKGKICKILDRTDTREDLIIRGQVRGSDYWYKVDYNGTVGWVFGFYTSKKAIQ